MSTFDTFSERAWLDQSERRMRRIVQEYGCYIQVVAGTAGEPPFAYTVGLFGLGHRELVVFGLDYESSVGTLGWFSQQVRDDAVLTHGQIVRPPGSGMRFLVERFPNPGATVFAANRMYQRTRKTSVPVYQLTWDVDGAFPWEPGYPYPATLQPRPGTYGRNRPGTNRDLP